MLDNHTENRHGFIVGSGTARKLPIDGISFDLTVKYLAIMVNTALPYMGVQKKLLSMEGSLKAFKLLSEMKILTDFAF